MTRRRSPGGRRPKGPGTPPGTRPADAGKKLTAAPTKKSRAPEGLPDREALLTFIRENPGPLNKREIARAFGIKGQDRTQLRVLLRRLTEEGAVARTPSKSYGAPDALPDTAVIEITGLDDAGELLATPAQWQGRGPAPVIYIVDKKRGGLKTGDRTLARLKRVDDNKYEARILNAPASEDGFMRVVGVFKPYKGGGYVYPTDKKVKEEFFIPAEFVGDRHEGDLVIVERVRPTAQYPKSRNPARIVEFLGKKDDPRLISLIAIHSHGIPTEFPAAALAEAEALSEPDLSGGREDLRHIPLVTIDGADARDFDDAVFAEPDTNPENEGGWHLIVAIADVSFYVRPGSALDIEALKRGNSTYFADRVVPMLPERLSNDLCSLRPLVNRACLAVHMTVDKNAKLLSHKFVRGLMRSAARLTYEQIDAAHKGQTDDTTAPLMDKVIHPLYKAYALLKHARQKRGALELDLPERKPIIDKAGNITAIVPRERLDSHQLVEEFMIMANVAAAMMLEKKSAPCVYRIHDQPSAERIEATRLFLKEIGYSLPQTDQMHPRNINNILKLSSERGDAHLVHTMLLRTQSQAIYHPDNVGHFGLALEKYAHFTSPIRRYADLVVHRSLVNACGLGAGGLTPKEAETIYDISEHISTTERRSMLAERDVMDRFTAQFLSAHIGQLFKGRISSVAKFGLFVSLDDSGADGIVPMRQLPNDYYVHDEKRHALVGKNSGRTFRLADPVVVRLMEADRLRGSTVFEIAESMEDGDKPARVPQHPRSTGRRHRHAGEKRTGEKRPDGPPRGGKGKKRRR